MAKNNKITFKLISVFIKSYQKLISPFFGNCCRFEPSCSNYALMAFSSHGLFIGFYLTLRRLLKCHPFCQGGYDPVPKQLSLKIYKEN